MMKQDRQERRKKKDVLCTTERLVVRRFVQSDLKELYKLLSDPEVMVFLEPPYTYEQAERFMWEAALTELPLVYAVEDREEQFLGYVIYHGYGKDSVELGWVLKPSVWDRGYASELTRGLLKESEGRYTSAIIECVPRQEATKAIARKNGFCYMETKDGCEIFQKEL